MEMNNGFVLVKRIIEKQNEGGITIVEDDTSIFAHGIVVQAENINMIGKKIIYFEKEAKKLGLGYESDLYIILSLDIIAIEQEKS